MVLGGNQIEKPWGTHKCAGGTHRKCKGEQGKYSGISKRNVRGSTRGNAHERRACNERVNPVKNPQ